ncbi:MAG: class I SAM-dependent methyltransferase [Candidatus Falkowbacteria bacterium]
MLQKIINKLASNPKIFIILRKIIENNFRGEKEVINKHFICQTDDKILDLGCGTGEFSVYFNPEIYTGLDIEKGYIDFAQKNYKGNFLVGDATCLPFSNNSFSKILIIGVLHHLDNEVSSLVLKEASRVLKDNGLMLIMEDMATPRDNILTKFIHDFDKGKFIRTSENYKNLLRSDFKIIKDLIIKSGLCPYQVFLLKKKND